MTNHFTFFLRRLAGLLLAATLQAIAPNATAANYLIGMGISDITGEAIEVG